MHIKQFQKILDFLRLITRRIIGHSLPVAAHVSVCQERRGRIHSFPFQAGYRHGCYPMILRFRITGVYLHFFYLPLRRVGHIHTHSDSVSHHSVIRKIKGVIRSAHPFHPGSAEQFPAPVLSVFHCHQVCLQVSCELQGLYQHFACQVKHGPAFLCSLFQCPACFCISVCHKIAGMEAGGVRRCGYSTYDSLCPA